MIKINYQTLYSLHTEKHIVTNNIIYKLLSHSEQLTSLLLFLKRKIHFERYILDIFELSLRNKKHLNNSIDFKTRTLAIVFVS